MMLPEKIAAVNIGATARDLLARNREAVVIGMISRGVFLRFSSGWVIFISPEILRGPLTLNCPSFPGASLGLQPGDAVEVIGGALHFQRSGLAFGWDDASTWQAPELPTGWLTHAERKSRLVELVGRVLADPPPGGFTYLLPGLLNLPDSVLSTGDSEYLQIQLRRIQQILSEPSVGYEARLAEASIPFIGLGDGLTPSGDDLILGLLLALNRWGERLFPHLKIDELNQVILERVDSQTTSLSVSLIRCAAAGQADERLISALDGLMTGTEDISTVEQTLRSWGNSSGIDALVGMATAILACIV
jgi:hypothetical protein